MALVTMSSAAIPGYAALHALPPLLCPAPRRCCWELPRKKKRSLLLPNVKECRARVRVRGEKINATAQTPGAAAASAESSSVSMDNISSVEELKAALLDSLEGAHHLFRVSSLWLVWSVWRKGV